MILENENLHNQHLLIKSFCKNANIPIGCYNENVFKNRINLFDRFLGTKDKFDDFEKYIKDFDTIEEMYKYEELLQEKILEQIKNNPFYDSFIHENFEIKNGKINEIKYLFIQQNLYNENNDGKLFLSIDLSKANFAALNHYSNKIFGFDKKYNTWEDFIKMFTDYKFLQDSKRLRQIIMGKLNSKRIEQYETYMMACLIFPFIRETFPAFNENCLISLKGDELIFDLSHMSKDMIISYIDILKTIEDMVKVFLDISVKCNIFKLVNIHGVKSGFLKIKYYNNYSSIEIKGVNHLLYPFIADDLFKYINGKECFIKDYDSKYNFYFYESNTNILSKMLEKPDYKLVIDNEDLERIVL